MSLTSLASACHRALVLFSAACQWKIALCTAFELVWQCACQQYQTTLPVGIVDLPRPAVVAGYLSGYDCISLTSQPAPALQDGSQDPAPLQQSLEALLVGSHQHAVVSQLRPSPPERQQQLLINGIHPPLETPVAWLHANMHYPDHFMYIVIRTSGAKGALPVRQTQTDRADPVPNHVQ